ncbi:MAG: hypothetical protein JJP05_04205 [cyanobacterium endosymbiont of Rhopalodia gibba]
MSPYGIAPNIIGKLDVGRAIGRKRVFYVVRDGGYTYPYITIVELVFSDGCGK